MLAVFLDTETSGLDPFLHVPLEIAFVIMNLCTGEELCLYERMLRISKKEWEDRDPQSVLINGFTFEELQNGISPESVSSEIEEIFSNFQITNERAFFICQNPSFDRPFFATIVSTYRQEVLKMPYHWLDLASMYWALRGSKEQSEFGVVVSKDAIAHSLKLDPEARPHRAMNGARHLCACYKELVGVKQRAKK
jgi:DNA polymerase-3 subunit epsilon/oligoribonuclease